MSPQQTIAVLVRLFAIWLGIYFVRMLPAFYDQMLETGDSNATVIAAVVAVLIAVALLLLWFFPRTIGGALLGSAPPLSTESASPDTWFAIGCALIGLWLLIPGLTRLLYNLSLLYLAQRTPNLDVPNITFAWIYYVIEIAFGVWLLLGAKGARKLFWWARRAE